MNRANVRSWQLVAVPRLKEESYILYPASRDSRTQAHAGILVSLLVGYAFSPIGSISDFILVVGLLVEMVVVPLGVILARKMTLGADLIECREILREGKKPVSWPAAVVGVVIWLLLATLGGVLTFRIAQGFGT